MGESFLVESVDGLLNQSASNLPDLQNDLLLSAKKGENGGKWERLLCSASRDGSVSMLRLVEKRGEIGENGENGKLEVFKPIRVFQRSSSSPGEQQGIQTICFMPKGDKNVRYDPVFQSSISATSEKIEFLLYPFYSSFF